METNHAAIAASLQVLSNITRSIERELASVEDNCECSKEAGQYVRKAILANQELTRLVDIARAYECVAERRSVPVVVYEGDGPNDTERLIPVRRLPIARKP